MTFFESLRLAIALGLTLFLVLLRFDSERITRSDYFRYRTPWMGPVSYYILVIGFAIGIAIILPSGREQLFLTGGDTDEMLPIMLLFVAVAMLNGVALAFLRYGGILPLPVDLLPSRVLGAAAKALLEAKSEAARLDHERALREAVRAPRVKILTQFTGLPDGVKRRTTTILPLASIPW